MTLLTYYMLANVLLSIAMFSRMAYKDKAKLNSLMEEYYKEMPGGKTSTSLILTAVFAFFAIPVFLHNLIKGDK